MPKKSHRKSIKNKSTHISHSHCVIQRCINGKCTKKEAHGPQCVKLMGDLPLQFPMPRIMMVPVLIGPHPLHSNSRSKKRRRSNKFGKKKYRRKK